MNISIVGLIVLVIFILLVFILIRKSFSNHLFDHNKYHNLSGIWL
jgi:hypothetical protein